jgi:hypothetical protein
VFRILQFPHQEKIVTVDQLDYCTPDLHNSATNNVPFLGSSLGYESVGVGLLKDSSLVGIFPVPPPDTPEVSMLNMILTQVQQSLESLDPLVVPSLYEHSYFVVSRSLENETDTYEHSSLSLSISLKNEIDPPPFESSLPLHQKLEPSFPLPSENISISNQTPTRGKKKNQWSKRCLGGRSPTFGHHAGVKPLASTMQAGNKIPLERHASKSDPHLGVVHIVM